VNATVQLSTEPAMRGRVVAILLAIALGGTPLGAPLVGYVADHFGARWSLGVGALAGLGAALVGALFWLRHGKLLLHFGGPAEMPAEAQKQPGLRASS
jgi:MFS family permease